MDIWMDRERYTDTYLYIIGIYVVDSLLLIYNSWQSQVEPLRTITSCLRCPALVQPSKYGLITPRHGQDLNPDRSSSWSHYNKTCTGSCHVASI